MLKNFVKNYYYFLDQKVKNGTLVILIISLIIILIWLLSKHEQTISHIKTSLIEANII